MEILLHVLFSQKVSQTRRKLDIVPVSIGWVSVFWEVSVIVCVSLHWSEPSNTPQRWRKDYEPSGKWLRRKRAWWAEQTPWSARSGFFSWLAHRLPVRPLSLAVIPAPRQDKLDRIAVTIRWGSLGRLGMEGRPYLLVFLLCQSNYEQHPECPS